jgi:hypothetical protein
VFQVEFSLDRTARDGNVDAIQVSDGADGEHPEDQHPTQAAMEKSHVETQDASYHCSGMIGFDKVLAI